MTHLEQLHDMELKYKASVDRILELENVIQRVRNEMMPFLPVPEGTPSLTGIPKGKTLPDIYLQASIERTRRVRAILNGES